VPDRPCCPRRYPIRRRRSVRRSETIALCSKFGALVVVVVVECCQTPQDFIAIGSSLLAPLIDLSRRIAMHEDDHKINELQLITGMCTVIIIIVSKKKKKNRSVGCFDVRACQLDRWISFFSRPHKRINCMCN
jgi:hypothetical protein